MSHNASKWVWDQIDIVGSAKLVLLRLADHADPSGASVRPGLASVAKHTGLSERQVGRYISAFVKSGILVIDANALGGRGRIPEYRFTFEKEDVSDSLSGGIKSDTSDHLSPEETMTPTAPIAKQRVTPMTVKGDMEGQQRVTSTVVKGDIHACAVVNRQEPSIEPSKNFVGGADAPKPKRSCQLPEDFRVSDGLRTWAAGHGFTLPVIEFETEKFIAYWQGEGTTKKDWFSAWRVWMLRIKNPDPNGRSSPTQLPRNAQIPTEHDEGVQDPEYWLGTGKYARKASNE